MVARGESRGGNSNARCNSRGNTRAHESFKEKQHAHEAGSVLGYSEHALEHRVCASPRVAERGA